jgi:hypothetical protein
MPSGRIDQTHHRNSKRSRQPFSNAIPLQLGPFGLDEASRASGTIMTL